MGAHTHTHTHSTRIQFIRIYYQAVVLLFSGNHYLPQPWLKPVHTSFLTWIDGLHHVRMASGFFIIIIFYIDTLLTLYLFKLCDSFLHKHFFKASWRKKTSTSGCSLSYRYTRPCWLFLQNNYFIVQLFFSSLCRVGGDVSSAAGSVGTLLITVPRPERESEPVGCPRLKNSSLMMLAVCLSI